MQLKYIHVYVCWVYGIPCTPSFWKELFMWEGSSPSWGHMHKAPCVDLAQVGILLLIDLLTSGGVALNYLIKFRLCGGQMSVESEWSKHTFVLCAIYCSAHNKFYSVCNLDVGEMISILFKHFSGGFSPLFFCLWFIFVEYLVFLYHYEINSSTNKKNYVLLDSVAFECAVGIA